MLLSRCLTCHTLFWKEWFFIRFFRGVNLDCITFIIWYTVLKNKIVVLIAPWKTRYLTFQSSFPRSNLFNFAGKSSFKSLKLLPRITRARPKLVFLLPPKCQDKNKTLKKRYFSDLAIEELASQWAHQVESTWIRRGYYVDTSKTKFRRISTSFPRTFSM